LDIYLDILDILNILDILFAGGIGVVQRPIENDRKSRFAILEFNADIRFRASPGNSLQSGPKALNVF
jgi:hypothetical protein